jgi:hypothetical protein
MIKHTTTVNQSRGRPKFGPAIAEAVAGVYRPRLEHLAPPAAG